MRTTRRRPRLSVRWTTSAQSPPIALCTGTVSPSGQYVVLPAAAYRATSASASITGRWVWSDERNSSTSSSLISPRR